jgi:type III secretion system FlhB-like substrate exporter
MFMALYYKTNNAIVKRQKPSGVQLTAAGILKASKPKAIAASTNKILIMVILSLPVSVSIPRRIAVAGLYFQSYTAFPGI